MNDTETEAVRALMLGVMVGTVSRPEFLVKVDSVTANYDDDGVIQSFTVVTESRRRYVLSITFDGMEAEKQS